MSQGIETKRPGVLIVDGHPLFREGLVRLIGQDPGLRICAVAGDTKSGRELTLRENPDLVLLDLKLGKEGGLDFIHELKDLLPNLRVLVLADVEDALYAERALRAGALGYIFKTEESAKVLEAVKQVLRGELYLSPDLTAPLLRRLLARGNAGTGSGIESLSDREIRVLEMIGMGLRNREIADRLSLSRKTIDAHRDNIKRKLAVDSAAALARFAAAWVERRPPGDSSARV